jgi:nitrite reductase/ring-hydroxylating ferredoxin subunit
MAMVKAAKVSEIPPGQVREVQVSGQAIALANVAGKIYAISNTCLHQGGPLGEGSLEGTAVVCPGHGWEYEVTTGRLLSDPKVGVACYRTETQGEDVFVDLG